ncbi:MAG: hypothetical protein HC800_13860 [Phormidesmis sp. RL_2_1]|nr:hypothetical protein [Phormidesmis sp. RL_2_1]
MPKHWAITIGINQYRHLQPLMHAQNDALFVHRFLTEEAGLLADCCVLLSDLTISVEHQVVYPDKLALAEWIQTITQQVDADDVLWLFFSGYGAQEDGLDYLMPIDGDPGQVTSTGIAAADLIETLASLPTNQVLLLLDINRSQGSLAGQAIGQQVIELAQTYQVATLLSCQPEQYSHETFGTRHGLFTAALLEALQHKCTTVGEISEYLVQRLPEICEHHWRPIQNPVSVVLETQKSVVMIPESALDSHLEGPSSVGIESVGIESVGIESVAIESVGVEADGVEAESFAARDTAILSSTEPLENSETSEPLESSESLELLPPLPQMMSTDTEDSKPEVSTAGDSSQVSFDDWPEGHEPDSSAIVPYQKNRAITGAKLRNWGLLALALLMAGVLLKQPFVKTAWQGLVERIDALGGSSSQEDVSQEDGGGSSGAIANESSGAADDALEVPTKTETEALAPENTPAASNSTPLMALM